MSTLKLPALVVFLDLLHGLTLLGARATRLAL
jgi:hypothetical protein